MIATESYVRKKWKGNLSNRLNVRHIHNAGIFEEYGSIHVPGLGNLFRIGFFEGKPLVTC